MFLLLGHGYWGKNIARTFGSDLYAVCEANESLHGDIQKLYPHARIYTSYDAALRDSNVQAVIIATKAATHFKFAIEAIQRGKHVWIEKPAGTSTSEIDAIIRLSEKKDVRVFVDHVMCHDPMINKIRETVDFGSPIYFESYRLHQGLFQPDVGVIQDLAVHDLSIIDFIFPNQKLVSKDVILNRHVNSLGDHAVLNMMFESGLRATVTCSWVSPIKKRTMLIAGSNAMAVYRDGECDLIKVRKLDESFSQEACKDVVPLVAEKSFGLENARDRFKGGILRSEDMITDIYQARRIQSWLE